jgi:hypothetical protein
VAVVFAKIAWAQGVAAEISAGPQRVNSQINTCEEFHRKPRYIHFRDIEKSDVKI